MECGSTKFLVGLGIGSAIGALVYHFSRTAKAKKLKNDVFNALREIEADAETAMEDILRQRKIELDLIRELTEADEREIE